jgi:hypothetical protein
MGRALRDRTEDDMEEEAGGLYGGKSGRIGRQVVWEDGSWRLIREG